MKKPGNCVLFAVCVLVFWAQQSPAQFKVEPMPMPLNRQVNADDHLHMLTQQLNLTKPQQVKIRPILERYVKQRHAIMLNNKLSADAKSNQLHSSETAMHTKVRHLLTAEQKQKFDEIMGPPEPESTHRAEHARHTARAKSASTQK